MVAVDFEGKCGLFPFRRRAGEVVAQFSVLTYGHLLVRWLSCPFELLEEHLPSSGTVYDLGCGHGLFLHYLVAERSALPDLCGLDVDERKIAFAQKFRASPRMRFAVQDITADFKLEGATGIVLNDVLHLVSEGDQESLLQRCFQYLPAGGILLIKDIERSGSWKYRWTRVQEFLVNRVFRWTIGNGYHCRTARAMTELLARMGFQVQVVPAHRGYPYAHIIYLCRKV